VSALDDIRARADAVALVGWGVDLVRLLAAVDAVLEICDEKVLLWDAICGNTCCKGILDVNHNAIADEISAEIRRAVAEALEGK
jgi:hypothetical protein